MVAFKEIRRYQKSTECLIKRSPFQILIIGNIARILSMSPSMQVMFQSTAIAALLEAAEIL